MEQRTLDSLNEQSLRSFDVATARPTNLIGIQESADSLGTADEDVLLLLNTGDRLQGGSVLSTLDHHYADDKLLLTHSIALNEATGEVFGQRPRSLAERLLRPRRPLTALLPCLLTFRYGLFKKVGPHHSRELLFLKLLSAAGRRAAHLPRAMLLTREQMTLASGLPTRFPRSRNH